MCGLHRAQALEDRIVGLCEAPPASQPYPPDRRAGSPGRLILSSRRSPSPERIAARLANGPDPVVRCQPIGAVIADICRDLGILPNHPLWRDLQQAINAFRGKYARLVIEIL
jgi:hypothetical protein